MSRQFEYIYPYLLAILASGAWFKFQLHIPDNTGILSSSVTIGSIITGFMGTSKSMLMSLQRPIMDELRTSGYIHDLASYLVQTICLSFGFAVIALSGYFDSIAKSSVFGSIWIFLGVAAGASFLRVMFLTAKILRRADSAK